MQMKNDHNKNTIMYSTFATMSTTELKELLKSDCMAADDDQLDIDAILYIMEVIDEREKSEETQPLDVETLDTEAAKADFYATYFPEYNPVSAQDSPAPDSIQKKKSPRRIYLLVAALVAVLACSVSASAFELNIFKLFAQWTEDTFQMFSQIVMGVDAEEDDVLGELRDIVEDSSTLPLVPHWCPPGFEVVEIQEYALTTKSVAMTVLRSGEDEIVVTITHHKQGFDTYSYISEKEREDMTSFEVNNITHYILSNIGGAAATWLNGDFVCEIYGNVTQEDMEHMIESIY